MLSFVPTPPTFEERIQRGWGATISAVVHQLTAGRAVWGNVYIWGNFEKSTVVRFCSESAIYIMFNEREVRWEIDGMKYCQSISSRTNGSPYLRPISYQQQRFAAFPSPLSSSVLEAKQANSWIQRTLEKSLRSSGLRESSKGIPTPCRENCKLNRSESNQWTQSRTNIQRPLQVMRKARLFQLQLISKPLKALMFCLTMTSSHFQPLGPKRHKWKAFALTCNPSPNGWHHRLPRRQVKTVSMLKTRVTSSPLWMKIHAMNLLPHWHRQGNSCDLRLYLWPSQVPTATGAFVWQQFLHLIYHVKCVSKIAPSASLGDDISMSYDNPQISPLKQSRKCHATCSTHYYITWSDCSQYHWVDDLKSTCNRLQ